MPRFTITNRQRAPNYEQLRRHIASVDDVRVFADADPEEAGPRALQYADDFWLFDDLAWDRDDACESIRLTMPPIDLRRALMRLQAEGALATTAEEGRRRSATAERGTRCARARDRTGANFDAWATEGVGSGSPGPIDGRATRGNSKTKRRSGVRTRVSEMRRRRRQQIRRVREAALAQAVCEERRRLDEGGCGKAVAAY